MAIDAFYPWAANIGFGFGKTKEKRGQLLR
jgi:hypothetical protein